MNGIDERAAEVGTLTAWTTLADLDDEARNADSIGCSSAWRRCGRNWAGLDDESVVVVPSVPPSRMGSGSGTLAEAYEERFLFLLLLLRQPRLRMIYVTSLPVDPRIIEYYLALLPGSFRATRSRLSMVSVGDASPQAAEREAARASAAAREDRRADPGPDRSHLIPYGTTALEHDSPSPSTSRCTAPTPARRARHQTGCRRLFGEVGVPHPLGAEDLHGVDEVVDAIGELLARRPTMRQVIVKLNDGVSGSGNALVEPRRDLRAARIGAPSGDRRARPLHAPRIARRPSRRTPRCSSPTGHRGGAHRRHGPPESERAAARAARRHRRAAVHARRLLGGASGQSYLGCVFPADPAYSRLIGEPAMAIEERLAAEGVLGRFAVDFVVVRDAAGEWTAHAIESTCARAATHPFLTLQFLTDGRYDAESVVSDAGRGQGTSSRPTTSRRPSSGRSRWATCSTWSPGTASISTSPGSPASSST